MLRIHVALRITPQAAEMNQASVVTLLGAATSPDMLKVLAFDLGVPASEVRIPDVELLTDSKFWDEVRRRS